RDEQGSTVDQLLRVELTEVACPSTVPSGLACKSTWPIRIVGDSIDRRHPLVINRSIQGVLAGGLVIHVDGGSQQIRIGGPRETKHGPIKRLRGSLRINIPRLSKGGIPTIAQSDEEAAKLAKDQFEGAGALWAQCGVSFGPWEPSRLRFVDPPPSCLLAVGCGLGLPSSGGQIRVNVDGRLFEVDVPAGMVPEQVARVVSRHFEDAGLRVLRSPNMRTGPGSFPVVDLLVFHENDTPAVLTAVDSNRVSSDRTMPVCIGRVDLGTALNHFTNVDSMAGTVEERTLLKLLGDWEPRTVEAVYVTAFLGPGRIGQAFVSSNRVGLRNTVVIDRIGVAASNASHVLAHELGHVFLDYGWHPDDFGTDDPTLLMDSDAAIGSAFGPRRLRIVDCERVWRQSFLGQSGLLTHWPWGPLPKSGGG
ncbi:MAG: hypothetical protein FWD57_06915, partial [Polyangiaceae bacterium]|nr:hypothetical protein [Polyangiaceae bacterium]